MQDNQFKNLLDKAYSKATIADKPVIIRYTQSITHSVDDILNNVTIQKNMFYMNFPDKKNSYIGIGKSLSHKISSKKELVDLKNNKYIIVKQNFFWVLRFPLRIDFFDCFVFVFRPVTHQSAVGPSKWVVRNL